LSGRMSAEWWVQYRARRRSQGRPLRRRPGYVRPKRDRSAEYARSRRSEQLPVPTLMPFLQRGTVFAFWDDELRLDLAQEASLAELEGRDPRAACREYRSRERAWQRITVPLFVAA
jgi:hypothetical protein